MNTFRKSSSASPLIIGSALLISYALVAHASSKDDIVHPIKELGNCNNEIECRAFCGKRDSLDNVKACVAFAKKHNLLPAHEIEEAEKFIALGVFSGPGGCRNQKECELYCEDTAHIDECLNFAEEHQLQSPEELSEARKVATILREGSKLPGECQSKNECMAYCDDPSHMRECIEFARKAGLVSPEELAQAEKIIPLLEQGVKTPGNCGRKASCEAYCANPAHTDECLAFAEKAGLLPPEEIAEAKRLLSYIKSGETPGRCEDREACERYCSNEEHFDECLAFAEKAGMMEKEDVELAKRIKGKGPGGCESRAACADFCRNPANQEICLNFVKEHDLLEEFAGVETEIRAKAEAEARAKSEAEITACGKRSCGEMISCLKSVAAASGNESAVEDGHEGGLLPPEIQTKLDACIEELKANVTDTTVPPPADGSVPGETSQSEEYQRQYQAEYQKQYEAEYQRQYEEQLKSRVNCSLFESAPTCEYAGAAGSQNYNLCKQCFPNK